MKSVHSLDKSVVEVLNKELVYSPNKVLYSLHLSPLEFLLKSDITTDSYFKFGPNVTDEFGDNAYNTNFYDLTTWLQDDDKFFCASYFGNADVNSLAMCEYEREKNKIKTQRISSPNQKVSPNSVITFIGNLDEWTLFVKKNLIIEDRLVPVYAFCVLHEEVLPIFRYIPFTESPNKRIVRNFVFKTPASIKYFKYIAEKNEKNYMRDITFLPNQTYSMKLPKEPYDDFIRRKNKYDFNLHCGNDICIDTCTENIKMRKNTQPLIHHYEHHCKNKKRCCVVGCDTHFTSMPAAKKHYQKRHQTTPVGDFIIFSPKDLIKEVFMAKAHINFYTTTPIIGMDTEYISDTEIFRYFEEKIEDEFVLADYKVVYGILYILAREQSPISIGTLCTKLKGVVLPTDKVSQIIPKLINIGCVDGTHQALRRSLYLSEIKDTYPNLHEYLVYYEVAKNVVSRFSKSYYNINIIREWYKNGCTDENTPFNHFEYKKIVQHKTAVKIIDGQIYVNLFVYSNPFVLHAAKVTYQKSFHKFKGYEDLWKAFKLRSSNVTELLFNLATSPYISDEYTVSNEGKVRLIHVCRKYDDLVDVTDEILEDFPGIEYMESVYWSMLSMVSTKINFANLDAHLNSLFNPYGVCEAKRKHEKVANVRIYNTYFNHKLTNDGCQFYDILKTLNREEVYGLFLAYQRYAIDVYDCASLLRCPTSVKKKLVAMGLCTIEDNLLVPYAPIAVIKSRYNKLQEYFEIKENVIVRGKPMVSVKEAIEQYIQTHRFNPNFNFYAYFHHYKSIGQLDVPKERIEFYGKSKRPLTEIIYEASPLNEYLFSMCSFFLHVKAVGVIDDNLMVKPREESANKVYKFNSKYVNKFKCSEQLTENQVLEIAASDKIAEYIKRWTVLDKSDYEGKKFCTIRTACGLVVKNVVIKNKYFE